MRFNTNVFLWLLFITMSSASVSPAEREYLKTKGLWNVPSSRIATSRTPLGCWQCLSAQASPMWLLARHQFPKITQPESGDNATLLMVLPAA